MRWFCWHDWSKWKTYRWQGTVTPFDGSVQHYAVSRTQQARVCLKCGKEIHRRVYVADGSEYDKVAAIPETAH